MAHQTAVEWFVERLTMYGDKAFKKEITLGQYHVKKNELIEEAKKMEKEQIMKAHNDGFLVYGSQYRTGEQYYNGTFGNITHTHVTSTQTNDEQH